MNAMLEAIQDVVAAEPETDVQPDSTQPGDALIEAQLTQEISELWSSHARLSGDRKVTAKELRLVRARLAERLHEMKSLLSRPGRLGQWRGWLRQQGIPRSTADRLASRHGETLGSDNEENVPSGAVSAPSQADVQRLFELIMPRLKKKLPTPLLAFDFLLRFVGSSGLAHEWQENALVVLKPSVETAKESSGAVAAPAEVGQAAASTGAGDGAVL
jgi:hypothetical protein